MSNYSRKENPTLADLSLIWDSENTIYKLSPFSAIFTLYNESFTNIILEADSQYSTPLTGVTVTVGVNDNDTHLIITPAGTIAALTITLPEASNLRDKQTLLVTCTQVVTTLTVSGNGTTVNGAPAAFAADGYFTLKYDLTLGVWNRVG